MEKPAVSVIIPCYNQEKYLPICLESVLSQTLDDIEVICIDDGSQDGTADVLRSFAEKDRRVRVLSQPNGGAAACRNRALGSACGKYVIFCDSDDVYPSTETLDLLHRTAEAQGALAVAGSYSIHFEDTGKTEYEFEEIFWGQSFEKEGWVDYADYQFDYGFTRFLFRADALRECGALFPEYRRFEDPPFLVRVLHSIGRFYAIPDVVYRARVGYKIVNWDADTQVGLLKGLSDNLRFSREHGLPRLHELTVRRIEEEYDRVYHWAICDSKIFAALVHTNAEVDPSMLSDEQRAGHCVAGLYLLAPLAQQAIHGQTWDREAARLRDELARERDDKERLRLEAERSAERLAHAEAELAEVRGSTTWKVGSAVTALPRFVVDESRKRRGDRA